MKRAAWASLLLLLGFGGGLKGATPSPPGPQKSPHGGLEADCGECHGPNRWVPVLPRPRFVHDKTGFPLQGAHAQASCRSCHRSLVFSHVATSCADCHKDPHNHELGTQCEKCHSPRTWTNQREIFRAHNRTRFPLFAVHANVDCASCHKNQRPNEYVNTPTTCGACHLPDYLKAQNPNHAQGSFPTRCEDCHSMTAMGWKTTRFTDHNLTRFPLAGAHRSVSCDRCHPGGRFSGTPLDCYSCHQARYAGTTNPNHVAGNFPRTCESCHTVNTWRPASFTDHSRTRFPLTGAHQGVDCARCHVGGRYAGTPTDCYSCHRDRFQATTNPNHAAAGFPTRCETCHSTTSWRPASFDHNRTRFPLAGAHARVECTRCHVGGRYAGTPSDCYSCHRANFQAAANPNHVSGGFPTTCESCHTTSAWRPATLDHNRTRFPLTGAHTRVECARCHVGGRYAGTPTACYSCHQAAYNGTSNPNHAAAAFPTNCESCHSTSAWRPASFDHDGRYFPIYSGKHRGKWSTCRDCHQNASNYKAFECILCHEHSNKPEVDNKHRGVNGYTYTSAGCYRCHPRGTK